MSEAQQQPVYKSRYIEHDGSKYHGWQRQNGAQRRKSWKRPSVAGEYEPAKRSCWPCAGKAGRTDTAYSAARPAVVHFETRAQRKDAAWTPMQREFTSVTSPCVAKHVADDFHARFSATARRYRYVIYNRLRPAVLAVG